MRRVGIFGWGVVAPRSRNIEAFEKNLASSESWLSPFNGFGPDNFLVGNPEFDFAEYKPWIDARFPATRFAQLEKKMGMPTKMAIGSFIQALGQNPGLEQELQGLQQKAATPPASASVDVLFRMRHDVRMREVELRQAQERAQTDLEAMGQHLQDKLTSALNNELQRLGKTKGLALVVISPGPLSAYADPSLDLTEEALASFDRVLEI